MPCYTAIAMEDAQTDQRVTQELLASDLQRSIDNLNKDSVYFPNWANRFSDGLSHEISDRQLMIEQLKRFSLSPQFEGLVNAVTHHFSNLTGWLQSMSVQADPEAREPDVRIASVGTAVIDFESAFRKRYLPEFPDDAFFNQLSVTFYEVYQRTCLDILTLGHMALALKFGNETGDANCRSWCDNMAGLLLGALDEMSSADGAWTVCEPGMVTKMSDTVRELRSKFFPPTLNVRFCDLRELLFKQTVMELAPQYLQEHVFNLAGNEVHVVNAWRQFFGEDLGLETRETDILSGPHLLGNVHQQEQIKQKLKFALAPEHLLCVFADMCMDEFANQFADRSGALDADVLNEAHRKICESWGELPLTAFVRLDEETGETRLQQDAALLAGALLDQLVGHENLPDRIKHELSRLSSSTVSLFQSDPNESDLNQSAGRPQLFSLYNLIDPRVFMWVKRVFNRRGAFPMYEYSRVQLSDFPVDLLRSHFSNCPPFLLGDEPKRRQFVLMQGLTVAYIDADDETVKAFSAQPGICELGLGNLRKWPIDRDPTQARMCIILQMQPDSPFEISVADFYQRAWVHRKAQENLYLLVLLSRNAALLACMIRNGLIDVRLSLSTQKFAVDVAQYISCLATRWMDIDGAQAHSAIQLSLTELIESPLWQLSDEQRNQLRSAISFAVAQD